MGLFSRLIAKVTGASPISKDDWAQLERELLEADLGHALTTKVLDVARTCTGSDAQAKISEALIRSLSQKERALASQGAILIVGVNGTGKTTSAAKLAAHVKSRGASVLLGAADTFRAAAVDQLVTWGGRIGVDVVTGKGGAASVAFDATDRAIAEKSDYLIIDTAGRLHTKSDLLDELGKVKRVIEKKSTVSEVLLVIDATTGQNGLTQARTFTEVVNVTGLIVTKLDGSARGGIALAIESELDIPIKFVGTGEAIEDFALFDAPSYITALFA